MKYLNRLTFTFLILIFLINNSFSQSQNNFIGKPAPKLSLEHLLQCPYKELNWKLLKGKIVVLEFWATWCAPCVANIPHLNKLSDEFKNKNVIFISITDESINKIKWFLTKKGIHSWIGIDSDRSLFKALKIIGIPQTFIINRNGIIVANMRPDKLTSSKLSSFIKGNTKEEKKFNNKGSNSNSQNDNKVSVNANTKKPILEFKIVPIEKQKYSFYAFNPSIGEFNAKAISLRETLSLVYDFPSFLIIGPDSILERWFSISLKVPKNKIESFSDILKNYLTDALDLKIKTDSIVTDVYMVEVSDANLLTPSEESEKEHYSFSPGLILGAKISLDNLLGNIEPILKKPIVNRTKLKNKCDWFIEYDKNNPESLKKILKDKYGLSFTISKKKIKVLQVEK